MRGLVEKFRTIVSFILHRYNVLKHSKLIVTHINTEIEGLEAILTFAMLSEKSKLGCGNEQNCTS